MMQLVVVKPNIVSSFLVNPKNSIQCLPPPPLIPFRVLVGMDPYHHAQLLLCLPTPEGQDASPARTEAT